MRRLGVVAALEGEARTLGSAACPPGRLVSLEDGTLLLVSGIGGAAAGRGALALVEAGATALASWGVAGGLDPTLAAGTLLLPTEVITAEGGRKLTSREWRERLRVRLAGLRPLLDGRLLSTAEAIETAAQKAAVHRTTGAAAVDMESYAVAEVSERHRLPFLALRAIVDTASDSLPRVVVTASRSGRVRLGLLLRGLVADPGDLLALLRLAARYGRARRALAAVAPALRMTP